MATIDDGQGDLSGGGDGRSPVALDRLVRQAADGDEAAWRSLVEAYARRVYALLRSRGCDRELAEELTQGAFVKVARVLGRGGYSEQGKFEAWLFRIAMNGLRDEARSRRRRPHQPLPEAEARPNPAHGPRAGLDQADAHRLTQAVAQLGEADREVIELRHRADMSFRQIAALLGQPMGTVLARHHRALRKLRALLEGAQSAV